MLFIIALVLCLIGYFGMADNAHKPLLKYRYFAFMVAYCAGWLVGVFACIIDCGGL